METATRNSVTTIKRGYHLGLNKFIDWAIKEKLYLGEKPKFECVDETIWHLCRAMRSMTTNSSSS